MSIVTILVLVGLAFSIGLAGRIQRVQPVRRFLVFAVSLVCVYWLQPPLPIRGLSYWFPTGSSALVFLSWLVTSRGSERSSQENWLAVGFGVGLALLVALARFVDIDWLLPYVPPPFQQAAILAILLAAAGAGLVAGRRARPALVVDLRDNPVIFFEHRLLYPVKEDMAEKLEPIRSAMHASCGRAPT